ncbi:MAG: hypothetical protein ACXAAH_04175 [Promethearchaeota archaeon]
MTDQAELEFTEYTKIFIDFIKELFIRDSERITEILIYKSNIIVSKSDWKEGDPIFNLLEKWQCNNIPPMLTLKGTKFMKLHESPFNLIYRSIKSEGALLGIILKLEAEQIQIFSIISQMEKWQISLTAMKDTFHSIIELGQKMSGINTIDSNNIEIGNNYAKDKQAINKFIESMDTLEFICDYIDRGDSIKFNIRYEKREKIRYPDYMYK